MSVESVDVLQEATTEVQRLRDALTALQEKIDHTWLSDAERLENNERIKYTCRQLRLARDRKRVISCGVVRG